MIFPGLTKFFINNKILSGSLLGLIIGIPLSASLRSIFLISSLLSILLYFIYSSEKKLYNLFKTPLSYSCIGLFILACLGCFWGNADASEKIMILEKYTKFLFLPILIAGFSFTSRTFRCQTLKIYLLVMATVAIVSIIKWLGFFTWENPDPGEIFYNHIITSLMMVYATYICAWFLYINASKSNSLGFKTQLLYYLLFALFTFQIFFVNTGRAGYLTYAILTAFFFYQILPLRQAFLAFIGMCLLLGFIFYQSPTVQTGLSKVVQDFQSYKQNDKDTSIGYRLQFHEFATKIFKRHIWIGNGTGGFAHNFAIEKPVPSWNHRLLEPHNQYWLILSEFGLLGLLTFSYFLYTLIKEIQRLKEMRILALGILVIFLTGSFSDSLFFYSTTGLFLISMMALCLSEQFSPEYRRLTV